jgi:hypothetical protein
LIHEILINKKMKKSILIMVLAVAMVAIVNAQSRVEIKSSDLPKAITENITKDFSGFAVQTAYKVTANNVMSYEVVVAKGMDKEKLEYNSTGAFLKKEPVEHMSAQKPAPAKSTESTTKKN